MATLAADDVIELKAMDKINQKIDNQTTEESNKNTGTTTGSVLTGIIIFVLLVGGAAIIIYLLQQGITPPYPISPFNYGDIVTIRPAILTGNRTAADPNQYFTFGNQYQNPNSLGKYYGDNAFAATFNGKKEDTKSQWILAQFSTENNNNANQNVAGLGNRFFLQNKSVPVDSTGRLRYQVLNERGAGQCYSTTPFVIGANSLKGNYFETNALFYFLPTNFPNLYYILFPRCSLDTQNGNTLAPNDGIVRIRPWSSNVDNTKNTPGICSDCISNGTFSPYQDKDPTKPFNANVAIATSLEAPHFYPPYLNAQTCLFEVIKIG